MQSYEIGNRKLLVGDEKTEVPFIKKSSLVNGDRWIPCTGMYLSAKRYLLRRISTSYESSHSSSYRSYLILLDAWSVWYTRTPLVYWYLLPDTPGTWLPGTSCERESARDHTIHTRRRLQQYTSKYSPIHTSTTRDDNVFFRFYKNLAISCLL